MREEANVYLENIAAYIKNRKMSATSALLKISCCERKLLPKPTLRACRVYRLRWKLIEVNFETIFFETIRAFQPV